jgi:hypothetical protein
MMTDFGFLTIFTLAVIGMFIAIFGVFPSHQIDFPDHDDPPEESE